MRYVCAAIIAAVSVLVPSAMFGQASATGLVPADATVGQNLETAVTVAVNGQAPGEEVTITLTSGDPGRLLLSTTPGSAGSASIVVPLKPGFRESRTFYLQGLGKSGTVTYTARAPGFGSGTGRVTLAPSGFVVAGPSGIGSPGFVPFTETSTISVYPALLDSSLNFVAVQALAGVQPVKVNVTSSNPAVGTVFPATVTVTGGSVSGETAFLRGGGGGSAVLAVSAPAGFSTPAQDTTVTATVLARSFFSSCNDVTIGQNLQASCTVSVDQSSADTAVTLTSGDPSQLLLAEANNVAGSGSITVTIPAGSASASFNLQALGNSGKVNYTVSAAGFRPRRETITLAPSGVVIAGPSGLRGGAPFFSVSVSGGTVPLTVYTVALNSEHGFSTRMDIQQLRGGIPRLQVAMKSSSPGVGTITSPVTILSGADHVVAQFTPVSQGETNVSVLTPAGLVGSINYTSLRAQVTP